jgi:hypothetical protein
MGLTLLQRQFLPLRSQLQKRVSMMRSSPNSSKTFAYRKAPPYRVFPIRKTLIILQCFAQPLFEPSR